METEQMTQTLKEDFKNLSALPPIVAKILVKEGMFGQNSAVGTVENPDVDKIDLLVKRMAEKLGAATYDRVAVVWEFVRSDWSYKEQKNIDTSYYRIASKGDLAARKYNTNDYYKENGEHSYTYSRHRNNPGSTLADAGIRDAARAWVVLVDHHRLHMRQNRWQNSPAAKSYEAATEKKTTISSDGYNVLLKQKLQVLSDLMRAEAKAMVDRYITGDRISLYELSTYFKNLSDKDYMIPTPTTSKEIGLTTAQRELKVLNDMIQKRLAKRK